MKEVALVLAGTKFDPNTYIVQKHRELERYCSDFRLTVFTDQPASCTGLGLDIRVIKLPNWNLNGMRELWWYKLCIFDPNVEWTGRVLYMDLDTVIVNSIDKFWEYNAEKFCILQDFNRQFISHYHVSNSSIMCWTPGLHTTAKMYAHYVAHRDQHRKQFRGDQDYVTAWFKERADKLSWFPKDWAMSYKWEILHGGARVGGLNIEYPRDYYNPEIDYYEPPELSIAVFHGKPDPQETEYYKKRLTDIYTVLH